MPWLVYSGPEEGGDLTIHHRLNMNFFFLLFESWKNEALLVWWIKILCLVAQSCPTLCDLMWWVQNRGSSPHTVVEGANSEMWSDRHHGKINLLKWSWGSEGRSQLADKPDIWHIRATRSSVGKGCASEEQASVYQGPCHFPEDWHYPIHHHRKVISPSYQECDTPKLCAQLCPRPLDRNPIQTSYVNEGGWGRGMAALGACDPSCGPGQFCSKYHFSS